mmetsp:Transcript_19013/g.27860  ORF Transcript_19013/g.27860 Transcript_19013/m.27860 type:complete len:509 (-) Transcript_19013:265-1791(-)
MTPANNGSSTEEMQETARLAGGQSAVRPLYRAAFLIVLLFVVTNMIMTYFHMKNDVGMLKALNTDLPVTIVEQAPLVAENVTSNTNDQDTTIYYPRPRPHDVLVDCGCPYTCNKTILDAHYNSNTQTCIVNVGSLMKKNKGEEFSCNEATKEGFCPESCNPFKCKKPVLEEMPIDKLEPFTRHEKVVIVTKIMGYPTEVKLLLQALCLLTAAYNDRVQYDIVVFATNVTWINEDLDLFEEVVHPAKFTVVDENKTVPDLVRSMTEARRNYLLEMCNKTSVDEFHWADSCPNVGQLRYNWQAEFRSMHIWSHPALADYKYMLWADADSFCTMPWKQDPVDFLIKNKLAFAFSNFPQGAGGKNGLQTKIREHFNTTICSVRLSEDGNLYAETGDNCENQRFGLVHGFFHLSDLDLFRSNMNWMTKFIGEDRLSRNPDDQEAVTVASTMLAPGKARQLELSGIKLNIMHNGAVDGRIKVVSGAYLAWWRKYAKRDFSAGFDKCKAFVKHGS